MTNLSELLPSGGGAKEFEAVASGTLPNGQAVIMRSDGKVEAVGPSGGGVSLGTAKEFDQGNNFYYASFYDTNTDQTAIFYTDDTTNTYYGTACSAKISGTTMTVGTPQVFSTATTYFITCAFDERTTGSTGTGIVAYRGTSNYGYCKAAYIASSGAIQFGGSNTFWSSTLNGSCNACWAPDANCFVIGYGASNNEGRCRVVYPTSLGNITLGGDNAFIASNVRGVNVAPGNQDSASSCNVIVVFRDAGDSYKRKARIGQTLNTTISFSGSTYTWDSTYGTEPARVASVDYANGKVVVAYIPSDTGANSIGRCLVATVSGNTISFGSPVNFTLNQESYHIWVAPTGTTNEFLLTFADGSYSGGPGTAIIGTVSGTTPSYSGIGGGGTGTVYIFSGSAQFTRSTYDSDANAMIISYSDGNRTNDPNEVRPFFMDSSNSANFIGITSEAIANSATGKVNPQGGVATTTEPSAGETGTEATFGVGDTADMKAVFDSGSNRVVFGYQSSSTGYAAASVAEINPSNNSFTIGGVGIVQVASSSYNSITYHTAADKIVSVTTDPAGSFYNGVANVGTVNAAANTISYTGTVSYSGTATVQGQDITYDSTNEKVVICWNRFNYGESIVGTITAGVISFPYPSGVTQWETSTSSLSYINNTFDSSAGSTVVAYQLSGTGLSIVAGQFSSGSVTWGSKITPAGSNAAMSEGGSICFDSQNNKVVVPYENSNTGEGKVVVCTVSGTTVTAGSPVNFSPEAKVFGPSINSTFDSTLNKVIIAYIHDDDSYLRIVSGTVSGTTMTFDTPIVVTSVGVTASSVSIAYDSNANRSLVGYKGSTTFGAVYVTSGTQNPLTIDATYYVQDNGNITRTATGNTKIGKAISTTQLILNGAS